MVYGETNKRLIGPAALGNDIICLQGFTLQVANLMGRERANGSGPNK